MIIHENSFGVLKMEKKFRVPIIAFVITVVLIVSFVNAEVQNAPSIKNQVSRLQFNDSQETIDIQNGFSLTPGVGLFQIPYGSIIYHSSDGITRVFDSNGTQILIANDTDSQKITTSAGDFFATSILQVPSGTLIKENREST